MAGVVGRGEPPAARGRNATGREASLVTFVAVAAMYAGLCADAAWAAPRTDVVELSNGDRVTCEIRKLDRGRLTVKTDGLGTIAIEWDDIAHVASTQTFDIQLSSGEREFGSLARADAGSVDVVTVAGVRRLVLAEIVRVTPLGDTFWGRLDGGIDAGFSFTQANVQTQWTLSTNVSYRGRRWLSVLDGYSSLTSREDADRQTRNTLTFQSQRFLRPRWSGVGLLGLDQNEELSLNLRSVLGAGILRTMTESNKTLLTVLGGLAHTREVYAGEGDDNLAEALAGIRWQWFTFDGRSTSLDFGTVSFYALSRARVRVELNTTFKSDIVGDLYWSVNLYNSYNSDPPSGRKSNDFGVSAAVGWTF